MGIIRKTLWTTAFAATGYGYYLSKQYESIPFYQLLKSMQINSIVNDYKNDDKQYFAYCNTFHDKVKLDPKLILKQTEKDLLNTIIVNFFNSSFYRFEFSSLSQREFNLSDFTKTVPDITKKSFFKSKDLQNKESQDLEEKTESAEPLLEILPRKSNNSTVLKVSVPSIITKSTTFLSDYGIPYRSNDSSYQELYVELRPEINEQTRVIETYSADVYFSNADLYSKHLFDGKIMPRLVLSVLNFYNRLLLQSGISNINEALGSHLVEAASTVTETN